MDKNIYTILEVEYTKNNKLPSYWYEINNLKVMIDIISKALLKHTKIEYIEEYNDIVRKQQNDKRRN